MDARNFEQQKRRMRETDGTSIAGQVRTGVSLTVAAAQASFDKRSISDKSFSIALWAPKEWNQDSINLVSMCVGGARIWFTTPKSSMFEWKQTFHNEEVPNHTGTTCRISHLLEYRQEKPVELILEGSYTSQRSCRMVKSRFIPFPFTRPANTSTSKQ